jgi:putative hemolysin
MQNFGMRETTAELLAVFLVVIPLTYLSVVVGELVPKTLALRNPAKIILAGAKALFVAERVLSPAVTVLEWSTKRVMRIFFSRGRHPVSPPQTTVEIDALSPTHQQFVLNMANIEKKQIKDILLPWGQVNFVRSTDSLDQVMAVVFTSGHTRLPVIDNGNVLGILHTKEFLAFRETGEKNWNSIVRPVLKIQTIDSALGVLRMMQEKRNHMAVVFTLSGERTGIVTLEDIIEEIVGDIFDEDDDGRIRKVFAAKVQSRVIPKEE